MSDPNKHFTTDERFDALEAKFTETETKLSAVEAENVTLKASVEKVTTDLNAATELNTEMEAKITALTKEPNTPEPEGKVDSEPAKSEPAAVEPKEGPALATAEEVTAAMKALIEPIAEKVNGFDAKIEALKEGANKGTLEANLTKQPGGEDSIVEPDASTDGTGGEPSKKTYAEMFESDKSVNPSGMTYAEACQGSEDGIYRLTLMEQIHGTPAAYAKKNGTAE